MLRDMFSFQGIDTTGLAREVTALTANATVVTSGGRDDGPALHCAGSNSAWAVYMQKTYEARSTWIVGFRFKVDALPNSSPVYFLKFVDGATVHVQIALGTDGTLQAYRDTTLLGSSVNAISTNVLYYLEVKVKIDASTGTVDIHEKATSWLALTAQDTRNGGNASANTLYWGAANQAGGSTYYGDLYVADTQPGAVTDFLGPQRCDSHFFTADGYYTAWTPSIGTSRFGVIDDSPANDDVDYASGALGNKMTVKTLSLGYEPAAIAGVKLTGILRKTASGNLNVQRLLRKGGSDYHSSNLTPPDLSYGAVSEVLETDPATSAAFTRNDLENQLEWGFEVTA